MSKGLPYPFTPEQDQAIRDACNQPGGIRKLTLVFDVAYSTLTKRARKLNCRPKSGKAPERSGFAKHHKAFNAKIPSGKAPEGPAVIPKGVKITKCPNFEDRRFKADPGHSGLFSKLGIGRYQEE